MPPNTPVISSAELQAWLNSVPDEPSPPPQQLHTSSTPQSSIQALNSYAASIITTGVDAPIYGGKNQASLDTPFYYLMWPDNTPVHPIKRLGLYETAVMEAEKFSKRYSRSIYILKCVGAMIFEGPKLKEHSEDDDNAF